MRHAAIIVMAFGLAACGGATLSSADICNAMIEGDAEAVSEIRRDGIEPAEFCGCLGATVDTKAEDEKATILAVMTAVTNIRTSDNVGVEDAAEKLEDQLRGGTGGHDFTEEAFQSVGQLLNDIGNELEDGGACKAG